MKKFLAALVAVAIVVLAAPPADAQPHVSKREWQRVEHGMSKAKVHRIFGTRGRLVDSWPEGGWQARTYRPWRNDIYLMVDFVREGGVWRLDSKSIDRDCGPCFRSMSDAPLRARPTAVRECATTRELRRARAAWRLEGLTRPGVHHYLGFDGSLATMEKGVMKRRYRHCREGAVAVRYRHFPEAPGPSSAWWVVSMRRVA